MKKLFLKFLFLLPLFGITSCDNSFNHELNPNDSIQLVKSPDIIAYSGNQLWGSTFETKTVNLPAMYGNQEATNVLPNITDDELVAVVEYFKIHQGKSDAITKDFKNFYVQQVYYSDE